MYLSGAFGQSQDLYRARNELKRGRGTRKSLNDQVRKDSKKVIEGQERLNCRFVMDPQFNYFDPLQPFVEQLAQVEAGPQENWFNNNTFYRRPQISDSLEPAAKSFMLPYLNEDLLKDKNMMVILPSPYTLYMLSDCLGYKSAEEAVKRLALVLRQEIEYLKEAGVKRIQFDEPAIAMKNALGSLEQKDLDLLHTAFAVMAPFEGISSCLQTYFGRVGNLLGNLIQLPVDCIGVDCTETSIDAIAGVSFEGKELALGIINARSPAMENVDEIVEKVRRVREGSRPKTLYLVPNTGFEFIGWTHGHMKLDILQRALTKVKNHAETLSTI